MSVDDQEFIAQFESATLDPFHHADHVRVAFAYLRNFPPLEALDRFAAGLEHFAKSKGKSQIYSETVTYAYFFLIRERMARTSEQKWGEFAEANSDLFIWQPGILHRYYRPETLSSELARRVFVFPDKL